MSEKPSNRTECEVEWCDRQVTDFEDSFPIPVDFACKFDRNPDNPDELDYEDHLIRMCNEHHVAARVFQMSYSEPPYVDVGLYQELTYYARCLACMQMELTPEDWVLLPEEVETTEQQQQVTEEATD